MISERGATPNNRLESDARKTRAEVHAVLAQH